MIKVSDYIIKYLEEIGIEYAFVLPGGMSMHLVDSLSKSEKIKTTYLLHEQACVMASESANILHNKLISVVITTAGPGILNAVTPIASAHIDSTPLLVISGQCKSNDSMIGTGLRQKGVQEVDALCVLSPITKYCLRLKSLWAFKDNLDRLIYDHCLHNRKGPVFLEIPLDIQGSMLTEEDIATNDTYHGSDWDMDQIDMDKCIQVLNDSKKPVILAGNGVRDSLPEFKELVKKLRIPVLTTWKSMDFMDHHDYFYYGRPGSISSRYANNILQNCDLLINIGSRLDLPTVAYSYTNFAKNAKKIIVDIDKHEIDKLKLSGEIISINCDSKDFVSTLSNNMDKVKSSYNPDRVLWIDQCTYQKVKYPICLPEYEKVNDYVNPYYFIDALSDLLTSEDIIVPSSSGSASEMVCQSFKVKEGQKVICANGLGSMGFALPHAIGAAATSNKRVICIEGDGSFSMNIQELSYLATHNTNMVVFIFNNNGYASIRNTQNKFMDGNLAGCDNSSGLNLPEISRLAKAYRLEYYCIKKHVESKLDVDYEDMVYTKKTDLKEQLTKILSKAGSIICEVMIDPEFQTQPKVMSTVDSEGKMVSGTLENMWPFLKDE